MTDKPQWVNFILEKESTVLLYCYLFQIRKYLLCTLMVWILPHVGSVSLQMTALEGNLAS